MSCLLPTLVDSKDCTLQHSGTLCAAAAALQRRADATAVSVTKQTARRALRAQEYTLAMKGSNQPKTLCAVLGINAAPQHYQMQGTPCAQQQAFFVGHSHSSWGVHNRAVKNFYWIDRSPVKASILQGHTSCKRAQNAASRARLARQQVSCTRSVSCTHPRTCWLCLHNYHNTCNSAATQEDDLPATHAKSTQRAAGATGSSRLCTKKNKPY